MFEKLACLLARWHAKVKNWHTFSMLTCQVEQLAHLWHVETFIGMLACKNEKLVCIWHVGTLTTLTGMARKACDLANCHTFCESVNVTIKTKTFMIWRPYVTSWSKRNLSRCELLDRILCEWQLVRHYLQFIRHYFEWVWVILGGQGWVETSGVLFWVGWGEWDIILSGWGWVGKYFEWVGVGGSKCTVW